MFSSRLAIGGAVVAFLSLCELARAQPLIFLATRSGRVGLVILAIAAIGGASAAVFDLNQVVLHELAGIIGIVGLPIAAVLISRELAQRLLRLLAHLTWIGVMLWIATFGLMIATFINATGGLPSEPPAQLPAGVVALVAGRTG